MRQEIASIAVMVAEKIVEHEIQQVGQEAIVDEVEILDVFGRQMTTAKNQIPTVIDVTKLNSGVYFIRMNTNKGEIIKRFVKE